MQSCSSSLWGNVKNLCRPFSLYSTPGCQGSLPLPPQTNALCGTSALAVARYEAFPKISLKKKLLPITLSKIKESLKQDPIWLEQPPEAGSLPQDAVLRENGALYMYTTKHLFRDVSFSKDIRRQLWSVLSYHYSEKELYKEWKRIVILEIQAITLVRFAASSSGTTVFAIYTKITLYRHWYTEFDEKLWLQTKKKEDKSKPIWSSCISCCIIYS